MKRWHIWAIKLLMIGTDIFGGCYFFLVMCQCTPSKTSLTMNHYQFWICPVSEFWNDHPASGKCIAKGPTLGLTYALAAVNASADWAFGALPLFIVWDLQANRKIKALVGGILAFAAIGSTATIVRMKYIHHLVNGPDFLCKPIAVFMLHESTQ